MGHADPGNFIPAFFLTIPVARIDMGVQERLKASQNLIVICSPNSAKSEWVGREIEFFHSLGRTQNIHFFIVDGIPHSGDKETECFNPVVNKLGLPEILGANIHEKNYRWPWLNKERAYVQLVSKLLNVEFDSIWQRHKRMLIRKTILWAIGIIAVLTALFCVWKANQPFDMDMRLEESSVHNDQLPPLTNAVVTMTLDNETKTDTIRSLESTVTFTNIPHRFLNQDIHFSVTCRDFLDLDTTVTLSKTTVLNVQRDPTVYGDIHFKLWDIDAEATIPNAKVNIEGREAISDDNGTITMFIPLEFQKKNYPIKADFPLATDTIHMPCGKDDVILVL